MNREFLPQAGLSSTHIHHHRWPAHGLACTSHEHQYTRESQNTPCNNDQSAHPCFAQLPCGKSTPSPTTGNCYSTTQLNETHNHQPQSCTCMLAPADSTQLCWQICRV